MEGNGMEINLNKSKALSFTTAQLKDPLNSSYECYCATTFMKKI
jgi:hypothetical protein